MKPAPLLPYTKIVGQERLKLALELVYVSPRIGGVLIRGQRGTGKSTAARSFAQMLYGDLPVTLPINATEDRVVGGWQLEQLLLGEPVPQPGLLSQANGNLLFVDEVNLLDDHIVNIILDVTSTGILSVQREGLDLPDERVSFVLVGTMNPDEGELRPQLLDRFGLAIHLGTTLDEEDRMKIIDTVLGYDRALAMWRADPATPVPYFVEGKADDDEHRARLDNARLRLPDVNLDPKIASKCVALAARFEVDGYRADYLLALAGCACAALRGTDQVAEGHIREVAPLVLMHRQSKKDQVIWHDTTDDEIVDEVLST